MLRTHDDWERLVAAVLKKQQLWELFHAHSSSPSVLSEASSSDLSSSSFRDIEYSSAHGQQLEDAIARLENRVQKLVLISDFVPAFDVEDMCLDPLKLLGMGTSGNTYVGDVNDGAKVVVKRVKLVGVSEEKFKRSMDVVGRVRHENVVALRAYYCSKDEKLMLYDYYGKGSAYQLLHGQSNETPTFVSLQKRLRIAIGAARGLASIHAPNRRKLIHGNVKSSNILLNQKNFGSISDFGITNLTSEKFSKNAYCYAPEVKNSTRNVSQESDVYSCGILLFELLTRKPPVQIPGGPKAVNLVKLIKSVKREQMSIHKVFDFVLLESPIVREQMMKGLQIGIRCLAKSPKKRPTMSEVANTLEDINVISMSSNLTVTSFPKRAGLVFVHQKNNVSESEDPFNLEILLTSSTEALGEGTFGDSYKITLEVGEIVKVKRLMDVSVTSAEFQQHIEFISNIKHTKLSLFLLNATKLSLLVFLLISHSQ